MCVEKEVTSVEGYIEWIKDVYENEHPEKHLFFRGQTNIEHVLLPSIFRKAELNEKEILLDFCNYADTLGISYDKIYQVDMLLGEMQHYGIPTRLLDWTVSPLVALFFACYGENSCPLMAKCDNVEKNGGAVYILDPWRYSKEFLKIDYSIPNNHQIQVLARALMAYGWDTGDITAYLSKKYIHVEDVGGGWKYPYPTVSPFSNDRKIHQRGAFLVWGESKTYDLRMIDMWTRNMFKCHVPHDSKEKILDELNRLYINEYTVYPDFEGMKKMIDSRHGLFNL